MDPRIVEPPEDVPLGQRTTMYYAGAFNALARILDALDDDSEEHDAFVNPVNGGWDGYRAECRTCDWQGPLHGPHFKNRAREDVSCHIEGQRALAERRKGGAS